MTPPHGPLHLSGALSIQCDGVEVAVHAEGTDVRIVTEDVGAFVSRARDAAAAPTGRTAGRRDLGELADALAAHGITAFLESPTRTVAVVGAGVDSAAGALLLGTRRARPRAAVVVIAARRGRGFVVAGGLAVVLGAVLARRRR